MKSLLTLFLLITFPFGALYSQIGGESTYQFLNLPNSARVAALGGTHIAFTESDLNLVFYNPSLLTDSISNQLTVNYVSYIVGMSLGYVSYAPKLKGKNRFAIGIHYVDYGTFQGASETGQLTGTFRGAEYAFNLFYSRPLNNQTCVGVNLKPIISSFESYQSYGVAADFGITHTSKEGRSAVSLVIKNVGSQITTYYDNGAREKLPWDILIGYSRKLAHAPIRFLITADHLNQWDLTYSNEAEGSSSSEETSNGFSSKLMRHLIFGAELSPHQNLVLRVGYNYQRQKELSIANRPGLVGFSGGIGIKIAKIKIDYGVASYHLSATSHYFSLSTNLSQFIQ